MLLEYYSIRLKDAEPGKGLLHTTQHWDEVKSSLKYFKEKHPGEKVVAFKHELKKGPMGVTFKRKQMFGEETDNLQEITLGSPDAIARISGQIRKARDAHKANPSDETKKKLSDLNAKLRKANAAWAKGADERNKRRMKTFTEATRSFNTLMRSMQDKQSIKSHRAPTPAERKAEAERFAATQKKPEPVKEAIAVPPVMGDTIHTVKHGEDTYTVHDMGSPRSSSRFKVRKNGVLQSNHASKMNAMNWLASRTDSTESKGNI